MNEFTRLADSGLIFAAVLSDALADGGVGSGFSRNTAQQLAREVRPTTAALLETTGPADVEDEVAFPRGSAIAGLRALEESRARLAVLRAGEEVSLRARALSLEDDE